jgi:hypothetical protein
LLPPGLVELAPRELAGFSANLYGGKLTYYSRREHLAANPPQNSDSIEDEDQLLERLEREGALGLCVTGGGGLGKTRLTLDLGFRAVERGWVVLRGTARLSPEAVAKLRQRVTPDRMALIVLDYAETHRQLPEILDAIAEESRDCGYRFRLLVSCRSTYWPIVRQIGSLEQVDVELLEASPRIGMSAIARPRAATSCATPICHSSCWIASRQVTFQCWRPCWLTWQRSAGTFRVLCYRSCVTSLTSSAGSRSGSR